MNVFLIVCDTLRADHLGCYGYFRNTTPNIDKVAKEGVLFEDFYCAGAPTGPGFTSIITGLYPLRHEFYRFTGVNVRQVDDGIFTMAEILRSQGYTTVAFDNLISQTRSKHFVRGYEFYVNCGDFFSGDIVHALRADKINARLIPWIKSHSDENLFLFVHYWDPHTPYNQPQEYREIFHHKKGDLSDLEVKDAPAGYSYVPGWGKVGEIIEGEVDDRYHRIPNSLSIDLYDGEIAYMDKAIGEVIETFKDEGIWQDTLTIITSDHGEQLGQHGDRIWEHNRLFDSVVHIPLIMSYKKRLPCGMKVKGFCQHIDILPTIMDLAGIEETEDMNFDGDTLTPLLKGKQIRETIFMEHTTGERGMRTKEWKILANEWKEKPHREPELYNVRETK